MLAKATASIDRLSNGRFDLGIGWGSVPEELRDSKVVEWNWPDIARFIQSLNKGTQAFA